MKWLSKEIGIFAFSLIFCYISHKFECYDTMIIFLIATVYFEILELKEENK